MTETRRPLMAGNWKMHKTRPEAAEFFAGFLPQVAGADDRDVLLCVPFTSLATALDATGGTDVAVGAQTMHNADTGAYTGEVAPAMLVDVGVPYVILGHSERRQYYAETDADLSLKVRAALDHGLRPILCVGETLDEREARTTADRLVGQLTADLAEVTPDELPKVAVAYEPIWAIGTGETAGPEQAEETIGVIRRWIADTYGEREAAAVRILYGGSVNPDNIASLIAQANIDGVLVGGASLDPDSFARIVVAADTHRGV